MPSSVARIRTDAAARYAKQLTAHLGHKVPVEDLVEGQRLTFGFGVGVVRTEPDTVVLEASGPDAESLARVEDVLGRHLERFGQRRELTVAWEGVDAEPR